MGKFTKPPPGAQINWGHPLARGLVAAVVFNEGAGSPFDLVRRRELTKVGNPGWAASVAGLAADFPATADNWVLGTDGTDITLPTTACTVVMIRRKKDTTLRAAFHFGVALAGGTRLMSHMPFSDETIYWDFGGTAAPNRLTWPDYVVSTNVETWVLTAGTSGSTISFNGVQKASQTTAITRSSDAAGTALFRINGAASANEGDIEQVNLFLLLNVEYTTQQAAWIHAAPYAFLHQQSPKLYTYGALGAVTGWGGLLSHKRNRLVAA